MGQTQTPDKMTQQITTLNERVTKQEKEHKSLNETVTEMSSNIKEILLLNRRRESKHATKKVKTNFTNFSKYSDEECSEDSEVESKNQKSRS